MSEVLSGSCTAAICPEGKKEIDNYCKICKFYWWGGTHKVSATVATEIITKEVVMVPCKYCGIVFPQTDAKCPKCGAGR